jgi:hypothetical protein
MCLSVDVAATNMQRQVCCKRTASNCPSLLSRVLLLILCVCVQVLGSNYKSELLAVIAPENLPTQFGGLSSCAELVDVGPWQDPVIIAQCPALRKAAAAGLLGERGMVASGSSNSLRRGSSSLIGAGSAASEGSNEEADSVDAEVLIPEGVTCV